MAVNLYFNVECLTGLNLASPPRSSEISAAPTVVVVVGAVIAVEVVVVALGVVVVVVAALVVVEVVATLVVVVVAAVVDVVVVSPSTVIVPFSSILCVPSSRTVALKDLSICNAESCNRLQVCSQEQTLKRS